MVCGCGGAVLGVVRGYSCGEKLVMRCLWSSLVSMCNEKL